MYTWKKRLLAAILAGCLSIGLMTPALAVEGEGAQPTTTPEVTTSVAPADEVDPGFSVDPTTEPTAEPTAEPAETPSSEPTETPAETPSSEPTETPSAEPTETPAETPTTEPTESPAETPSTEPTETPAETPSAEPTTEPTESPEITEIPEETVPGAALPGEDLGNLFERLMATESGDELELILSELSNEQIIEFVTSLSGEQYDELQEHVIALGAYETSEEPTVSFPGPNVSENPPVSFTDVAPLVGNDANAVSSFASKHPQIASPMRMMAQTFSNPLNVSEPQNDTDGLELSKSVSDNGDGTYTISLEAFVTGELNISSSEKSVPTDIVLVLDQSGSMADPFEYEYKTKYTAYSGNYLDSSTRPLFYEDGGDYYPVNVEVSDGRPRQFIYTYEKDGISHLIREVTADTFLGLFGSGWGFNFLFKINWIDSSWKLYYQETDSEEVSRLESLKSSVTQFVTAVRADAAESGVDHRIAIVGFASESGYGNNTEVLTVEGENSIWYRPSGNDEEPGMVGVSYGDANNETYKNAMVAADSVLVDHAIDALAANGATRSDLGMEMAQKILNQNYDPERNQVVIMFTDGTPTSSSTFSNTVANGAISNAKSIKDDGATVYTIGIFNDANVDGTSDENRYMNYVSSNYPNAQSMNDPGSRAKTGYYLTAANADELNTIFEKISDQIESGGASVSLGAEAVLKDVITPYFQLPGNAINGNVTVYTAPCNGKDGDTYTFGAATLDNSCTVSLGADQKTVSVTGFDFEGNYVSEITKNGTVTGYQGKKLIVEIKVSRADGFIGGNDVPTNEENSGIYTDSFTTEALENFTIPTANVPINLDAFNAKDANVYYGNDVPEVDQLITWNGTAFSDLEPWQKEFVTITDSTTTADTTTEGQYMATIVVAPITDGEQTQANGGGTANVTQTATATGTVNVFKLYLTYQDTTIQLGTTPNYSNMQAEKCNLVSRVWKHGGTVANSGIMMGSEPTLEISYDPIADAFQSDRDVTVSVTKGGEPYNGVVFEWRTNSSSSECTVDGCTGAPTPAHFRVHIYVPEFTFTLKKVLTEPADGDQSFIFKIEKDGALYMTVALVVKDKEMIASKEITLPSGTYTITEDQNWSWQYNVEGSDTKTVGTENQGTDIIFTNEKDPNTHWLGGSDSVENVFETTSGTSAKMLSDMNPAALPNPLPSTPKDDENGDEKNKDQNTEPDPSEPMETQEGGVSNV